MASWMTMMGLSTADTWIIAFVCGFCAYVLCEKFFNFVLGRTKRQPFTGFSGDFSRINMPVARVRDYELWRRLGKGTYGEVWLATHATSNKLYAIKTLDKQYLLQRGAVEKVMAEKSILQQLSFPFLIHLNCSFQDENSVYLVLDYVAGGDLFQLMHPDGDIGKQRRFSEEECRFYLCEIIVALEHLHGKKIIYRDLKPENILVNMDGHLKLTDFGLAKQDLSAPFLRGRSLVGTPEYMSPEMVFADEHGEEVDWWALGVLTYELLFGCFPFAYQRPAKRYPDVDKPVTFPAGHSVSEKACDLVLGFLQTKPQRRLGHRGAHEVKAHPFFNGVNWQSVVNKTPHPPVVPARIPAVAKRLHQDTLLLGSPDLLRRHNLFSRTSTDLKEMRPRSGDPALLDMGYQQSVSAPTLEMKGVFDDNRERYSTSRDVRESAALELVQLLRVSDRAHLEARVGRLAEPQAQWIVYSPNHPATATSALSTITSSAANACATPASDHSHSHSPSHPGSPIHTQSGEPNQTSSLNANGIAGNSSYGSGAGASQHSSNSSHPNLSTRSSSRRSSINVSGKEPGYTHRFEGVDGFITYSRSLQRRWPQFRLVDCEVCAFDARTVTVHWALSPGLHDTSIVLQGNFNFTFCGPKVIMGQNSYEEDRSSKHLTHRSG